MTFKYWQVDFSLSTKQMLSVKSSWNRRAMALVWAWAFIFAIVLTVTLFFFWRSWQSTYQVRTYKPRDLIEQDSSSLEQRLCKWRFKGCNFYLEWYTYDNAVLNRPPYKLFIVLEATDHTLNQLNITSIEIKSSMGKKYHFAEMWPLKLRFEDGKTRISKKLEPAFKFEFDAGETIDSELCLEFEFEDKVVKKVHRVNWIPVLLERKAPFN